MNKQTEDALCIAIETPLKDLLKLVPKDGFDMYEHSSISHQNIPYGRLIHMALIEIERLEAALESKESESVCKYGQVKTECYKMPMDCQCMLDVTFENQESEQEPVAWMNDIAFSQDKELLGTRSRVVPLYTRPTKRLSDDEIEKVFDSLPNEAVGQSFIHTFARAIEDKLLEINNG